MRAGDRRCRRSSPGAGREGFDMLAKQDIWEERDSEKDRSNLKEKKTKNQTYKSFTIETRDEKVKKGRTGDALALRGEEGRDKLR